MTLTVKLLLVAALVLGIIVPFGYFLKGERSKKRYKRALGANVVFYFGAFAIAAIMLFSGDPVYAAETTAAASNATGFGYIAAALSTGLSCSWILLVSCHSCNRIIKDNHCRITHIIRNVCYTCHS